MSSGPGQDKPGVPPQREQTAASEPSGLLTSDDIFGDMLDEAPAPASAAAPPAAATPKRAPIKVQVNEPGHARKERSGGADEPLPEDVAALLDAFSEPAEAAARVEAAALAMPPALLPPPAEPAAPQALIPTVQRPLDAEAPSLLAGPEATLRFVRPPLTPPSLVDASDADDLLGALVEMAPEPPAALPAAPVAPPAAAPEPVLELIPDDGPALLDEERTPPPRPAVRAVETDGLLAALGELKARKPAPQPRLPEPPPWPEDLPVPASRVSTKFQALAPKKAVADTFGLDLAALAADALGTAKAAPRKPASAKPPAVAAAVPPPAAPVSPPPPPAAARAPQAASRGELAYGPYRLMEKVAVGGMAEVFRAKRSGVEGFEKVVAVKRILSHLSDNKEFVDMFIDEAKMVAGLTHPNIVQIFDLGKIEKSYYIAMEYIHGRDLRTILRRAKERGLRVPLDLSVLIVSKVCSALEYAHRKKDDRGRAMKIVHRDVSPQNVLISFEGDVKLTDFGIAKAATKASQTDSGALRGKLLYMSPEQAWGKSIDRRSDVFSLGICFYEMITDNKPFLGNSEMSILEMVRECRLAPPTSLNPKLPERLEKVVMKALERDPDSRYQDAADMYRDLERVLHERQPPAPNALPRFMELLFDQDERGDAVLDENPSAEHRTSGGSGLEIEFEVSSVDKTPPVSQPAPDPGVASRATSEDPMSIQRLLKRFGIK